MTALRTGWAQRGVLVALGLLVCLTSLLLTAAPRVLGQRYDAAARQGVGPVELTIGGAVPERGLRIPGREGPSNDQAIQTVTRNVQDLWPARLRRIVRPSRVSVATPMTGMRLPGESKSLTLTWDAELAAHIRYVAGRAPLSDPGQPVVQVGMSVATARRLGFAVGEKVVLKRVTVRVSGLFEAVSPTDPFWALRPRVLTAPDVPISPDATTVSATGVMDADGFAALHAHSTFAFSYSWRYHVEPAELHAADVTAAATDVTQTKSLVTGIGAGMPLQLSTSLDAVLTSFAAQLMVTQSILYLVLGGLAAVALGVHVLMCGLLLDRLRIPLATMRARGASIRQIGLITLGGVAPVVLPSALAGFLLGLLVPGPGTSWAGAAAAASVALVVPTVIAAVTHRRTGGQGREDLVTGRLSPRRLVLETLAVVVAATGVIALRGRGLTTESATQGTDPFVAAVPVLVALAAGLLVLRIYPYPLRAVGVLSRRARSAVPFLGLAGASRQSRGTALPLIVLLMATSVAGFTASVDTGLRRAQTTASWQQVGADGLVTSAALDRASVDRVRKVPGVTDAVPVHTIDGSLTPVSGFPTTVKIVAVDLDGYRKVVAGRPVPVPPGRVLMSERLTSGSIDWAGGLTVPVTKTGTISRFPGVDTDLPLVVVPYASLGGRGDANAFPTGIFVRGSGFTAQALWKAAAPGRPDAEAKTFAEVHHELTRAPLVLLVQQSFAVTALLVGGYGLLALLLTMIISAEARGRTIAYLRTLGLSARQVRRLGLVEVGPVIGSATLAGWAVGLTVPRIIGSAVDLRPYTGGSPVVDFSPDLRSVLLLGGGLLLFGGLALVIDSAVSARRRLDGVLRVGEQ